MGLATQQDTLTFRAGWRGSMLRRFLLTGRVTNLEEEIAGNRPRTAALPDTLRSLSQRDPELAALLKNFNP